MYRNVHAADAALLEILLFDNHNPAITLLPDRAGIYPGYGESNAGPIRSASHRSHVNGIVLIIRLSFPNYFVIAKTMMNKK